MANTKITTPDLIDLPAVNNSAGVVLPKGPTSGLEVHYLVVAGGGGGGSNSNSGGGGAGGYRTSYPSGTTLAPALGSPISIIVGTGGNNTAGAGGSGSGTGSSGTDSTFDSITSTGGGYGGWESSNGASGGSGGGQGFSASGTPGAGNAGGFTPAEGFNGGTKSSTNAGGGGGASEDGNTNGQSTGGDGAISTIITTSIASTYSVGEVDGSDVYFAGGGGGGVSSGSFNTGGKGGGANGGSATGSAAVNATANTGGGGGGGEYNANASEGGSGVIIIRVPTGITASFSSGVTANGSTGGTISPDTSTGDNIWVVTATTDVNQEVTFSGTVTGGRPSSAVDGEFRYNTDDKRVEYYDGSNWFQLNSSPAVPQSGTTTSCNYPTTATALYQFEGNANDTCGVYNATSVTDVTYSSTAPAQFGQYALAGSSPEIVTGITQDSNVAFTWSFWFYATTISGIDNIIAASNQINVGLEFNKIWLFTGGSNRGSGTSVSLNTWTHYAVTFDGSSGFVTYLNGSVAENITQTPPSFTSGDVKLLLNLYGSWGPFQGRLDQLRIFPSVLTAAQVNALYTETAP
jgi:hypothetical protein